MERRKKIQAAAVSIMKTDKKKPYMNLQTEVMGRIRMFKA